MESIFLQVVVSYVLYILLLIPSINYYYCRGYQNGKVYINKNYYVFCLVVLCCIYCINGDYWTYNSWFYDKIEQDHIEPVFFLIKDILPSFFMLFRLVIWGGALLLFKWICDVTDVNLLTGLTLFTILYVSDFAYARASLGIMMASYSYVLLCRYGFFHSKKIIFEFLFFAILSCFFHKSILALWMILLMAYFMKFNRWLLLILFVFFPTIAIFVNETVVNFILEKYGEDFNIYYIYGEQMEKNYSNLWRPYSLHLLLLLLSFVYLIKNGSTVPNFIKKMMMAILLILFVSSILLMLNAGASDIVAMRFSLMAYPLGIIVISYYLSKSKISPKWLTFIIVLYVLYYVKLQYTEFTDGKLVKMLYLRSIDAI